MPNAAENEAQELDSFVEEFTAGLELDPNNLEETTPSATAEEGTPKDQDSTVTEEVDNSPKTEASAQTQQENSSDNKNVPEKDEKKNEDVEEVFTKSDKAFAELRVTNKQQGETLMRMARLANLNAKTPAEAIEKLSHHLDQIEANHGNLTYKEVERIRQEDQVQAEQKAQLQEQARKGF